MPIRSDRDMMVAGCRTGGHVCGSRAVGADDRAVNVG